jgi:Rps23 Pro-64 3,4-dihydroxylase Tpa1-like proline 4-hydroxylase
LETLTKIFDYSKWNSLLPELSQQYQSASPYPHIVLENFLDPEVLDECVAEFNKLNETDGWINYTHYNEKKKGLNKLDLLPETIKQTINELNSPEFLEFLSTLTGIKNLLKDEYLEGGGVHQSRKGGFLNIHADFTVHPHHANWQRRVNVLLYLNKEWQEDWGGKLELWDTKMKACEQKVSPIFNRAVIFNTDADSYHGHPEPLTCPEDRFRRSIALYYYSEEDKPFRRATHYKARPGEGSKKFLVKLDNAMVALYTEIKGRLGSNDKVISNILRFFSGKKK